MKFNHFILKSILNLAGAFFFILVCGSTSYSSTQLDRWAYIIWAKRELNGSLKSFQSMANNKTISLSIAELDILSKIIKYTTDRATEIENQNEVYNFSTELILSEDETLFKLSPNEPIRTAVTTAEPESAIFFNANIINNSSVEFGPNDALQILIHELGRKVVDFNRIADVDSLASKLRNDISKKIFYNQYDQNIKITVPFFWHTMISTNKNSIIHTISFLVETNGITRLFLKKIDFPVFKINNSQELYLKSALVPVGRVESKLGENYFQPIENALVNPTLSANSQIQQIKDVNYDNTTHKLKIRIEHQNDFMAGIFPAGFFYSFYTDYQYYEMVIQLDQLDQLKQKFNSDFSFSLRLSNDIPVSRSIRSLEPILSQDGHFDKITVDVSTLASNQALYLQVQSFNNQNLIMANKPLFMIPQTQESKGKSKAEYLIDWNLIESSHLKIIGLVINKETVSIFKNQMIINSSIKRDDSLIQPIQDYSKIESLKIESLSGWKDWKAQASEKIDLYNPEILVAVAQQSSFKLLISTTDHLKTIYLNWFEYVYIDHNDFALGFNKVNRQMFLSSDEFEQIINKQTQTSTITLKLPVPMQRLTSDLTSLQNFYDLLKINPRFEGLCAISQIELVTSSQKFLWNEFSQINKRQNLLYFYDRNQK